VWWLGGGWCKPRVPPKIAKIRFRIIRVCRIKSVLYLMGRLKSPYDPSLKVTKLKGPRKARIGVNQMILSMNGDRPRKPPQAAPQGPQGGQTAWEAGPLLGGRAPRGRASKIPSHEHAHKCTRAHTGTCIHTRTHTHAQVHNAHTHVRTQPYTHIHTLARKQRTHKRTRMHTHTCARTRAHTRTRTQTHTHTRVRAHTHTHTHKQVHNARTHIRTQPYTHTRTQRTHICARTHTYADAQTRTYANARTCACTHTYAHTGACTCSSEDQRPSHRLHWVK
jgi:hypothetical protein